MILSRVIEHIKHEPWTEVFIELMSVILGVFIDLQVNNWNAARKATLPWVMAPNPKLDFVVAEPGDDSGVIDAAELGRTLVVEA